MSINISIDSHYKIQSDSRQWILVQDDRMIGFFQDLESLIQSFFKRKILTSDAKTIYHLLEVHKQCLDALYRLLAPLQIEVKGKKAFVRPIHFKDERKTILDKKSLIENPENEPSQERSPKEPDIFSGSDIQQEMEEGE